MTAFPLTALCAVSLSLLPILPAQQTTPPSKKPVVFPLRGDRHLPSDGLFFLLESAPVWVLEEHGRHFLPYQMAKTGIGPALFGLDKSWDSRWGAFQEMIPKLAAELRGFDRGFSLTALYFPRKEKGYTRMQPEGITVIGQTSDKEWLQHRWDRVGPLFKDANVNEEEAKALGTSPMVANWVYGVYPRPDGKHTYGHLGVLGVARRGKFGSLFTGSYIAWNEQAAKNGLDRTRESGEKSLSLSLGAYKSNRKGARIQGLEPFQPKGTILGRVLFPLSPYIEQMKKVYGPHPRDLEDPKAMGMLSIQGVQDTVWAEGETIHEKIQVLENKGNPSVFEALAPLESDPSQVLPLLSKKAFGFFRLRLNLAWFANLFSRTQKNKRLSLSKGELTLFLNTLRAITALPIPKDPTSLEDLKGSVELTLLFGPPSPGSFWPEIFVLTQKRPGSLPPRKRLAALAQPFYTTFLRNHVKDPSLAKNIKTIGKGAKTLSFVNYGMAISKYQKKSWFRVPTGVFPGSGIFCAAEDKDYAILCFAPSAMRRFLRRDPAKTTRPTWLPKGALGQKGDLLQGALRLGSLAKVYPFGFLLAATQRRRPAMTKQKTNPRILKGSQLAKLFTTETFRIYRHPPKGDHRGLLVMDHTGSGLFSLFNISAITFGGITLDYLFSSLPRK